MALPVVSMRWGGGTGGGCHLLPCRLEMRDGFGYRRAAVLLRAAALQWSHASSDGIVLDATSDLLLRLTGTLLDATDQFLEISFCDVEVVVGEVSPCLPGATLHLFPTPLLFGFCGILHIFSWLGDPFDYPARCRLNLTLFGRPAFFGRIYATYMFVFPPSQRGYVLSAIAPMEVDLMPERDHGPSIKDDEQYEKLRRQGMSKEKAARIANTPRRAAGKRVAPWVHMRSGPRTSSTRGPEKLASKAARRWTKVS